MKVEQLKAWLDNFIDEADVEYSLNLRPQPSHLRTEYDVMLHVTLDGKSIGATFDLSKEEL